jgi:catechol 2,3-dioxygenase-like lactoylglutathione lyase family enzyme
MSMQVRRIDHVSFTVGDLDCSTAFYGRFGFEPKKRYISAGPDVDDGADVERADMEIQTLRHSLGGPMLELISYIHHDASRSAHNSRVGAAHICFAVDDVKAAHAALSSDGVKFLSDPHQDEFGTVWVYMRDPDGNAVEIMQDPPSD